MKKMFMILLLICFSTQWMNAQTMAFSAIEVKVKPFTQKDIKEAFEEVFEDVEMNKGAIVLERFTGGDSNGMTHRLVFLYTIGEKMIADEFWASDKNAAFWAKMGNYIEDWGVSYSGRMMSWKEGNLETNPEVHIWDIIPEDPTAFKVAHDKIVDEFKSEFKDRVVGFGTYDIGMPNGATHWIGLTGKDTADHLMLYDRMENNNRFVKLLAERGGYELIKDFSLKIISSKQ